LNTPPPINVWRRIFAPFAAGYFLSYLLRNANAVISPELTQDLGLSAADLGLLTAAYLLAFGASSCRSASCSTVTARAASRRGCCCSAPPVAPCLRRVRRCQS
jgi:sugar phosphate permease